MDQMIKQADDLIAKHRELISSLERTLGRRLVGRRHDAVREGASDATLAGSAQDAGLEVTGAA